MSDMEEKVRNSGREGLMAGILLHMPDLLGQKGLINDREKMDMKRMIEKERMREGGWRG